MTALWADRHQLAIVFSIWIFLTRTKTIEKAKVAESVSASEGDWLLEDVFADFAGENGRIGYENFVSLLLHIVINDV